MNRASSTTTASAGPSSASGQRPGLLRLMGALKPRPPFQVLVMSEESRLGRDDRDGVPAEQLVQANIRVFFYLTDTERTLDTPMDKVMLSLAAFADELEREKARQRTRRDGAESARGPRHGRPRCSATTTSRSSRRAARCHVVRVINETQAAIVERFSTAT
jgi:DNA invertase Pin-like site-specific DNA recombinase